MMDELSIPDFLIRPKSEITTLPKTTRAKRPRKIPYPDDGYVCKGKREAFRERHRARLRLEAELMRKR